MASSKPAETMERYPGCLYPLSTDDERVDINDIAFLQRYELGFVDAFVRDAVYPRNGSLIAIRGMLLEYIGQRGPNRHFSLRSVNCYEHLSSPFCRIV